MTGPEVQQELARGPHEIPIIFITGHREDGPRLSNLDAAACLLKPFSDDALREALAGAFRAI
jgi:CheY-like chemotaxis protein